MGISINWINQYPISLKDGWTTTINRNSKGDSASNGCNRIPLSNVEYNRKQSKVKTGYYS